MKTKCLYINTIGCQMNVYDSEQIAKILTPLGYKMNSSIEFADLIIVNTCAIREKAEQKVFSFLGRIAGLKRKKPGLIIGVGGCVAQQEGERILERMPHVDLIFGTHAICRLPYLIQKIEAERCSIVDVEMSEIIEEFESVIESPLDRTDPKATSFVTIMRGCDNFCTYCVVPHVRGRETSRLPESIVKEVKGLVKSGVREVTLLGQNVNSYGKKEKLTSFPQLLALVNEIDGLFRIRFTTSHPKDLSDDLISAFNDLDKLCNHIHLPVQSGSNRILKRMNRKYTRELYLEKIEKLRNNCPGIAITSDIIVGFPGETIVDFEETLDLIKQVEFDGIFAFKYSDRPNAPAARFTDKITEQENKERLQILLDLQEYFTTKKNSELVGSNELILVEGLSKKKVDSDTQRKCQYIQWSGRTATNKVVNFIQLEDTIPRDKILKGKIVNVKIEKAYSHSLWGKPVQMEATLFASEGEQSYAA
ncbi:MAG: tRNA (N6-isopentenyl adenosine(37)-C2)-methylthiotransferase MiaB [Desulfobacteraceae bacterium]|nr:tRNA (N6-isopentenyl adenosine(37)-C2)-methylthiotransferase MiaB [Desulfobacteraceae bacterium]MBU2522152.1 tRNA (N6-isopentenyl adenosine(37)-C2)-methylthiotransferase MiaB [Pseudomonadota bacterium]